MRGKHRVFHGYRVVGVVKAEAPEGLSRTGFAYALIRLFAAELGLTHEKPHADEGLVEMLLFHVSHPFDVSANQFPTRLVVY